MNMKPMNPPPRISNNLKKTQTYNKLTKDGLYAIESTYNYET